jgi:DtxR family Mn-dependent transcriptional regulator
MEPSSSLSEAMEDYLEAIYHLEQERRIARVRDIANRLGVKMSSVSSALKILGSRGLISYDPHQYITLTDRGIKTAKEIVRKHEVLKRFLFRILQVEENIAEENACRIEHHLDPEVMEKLIRFVEFMEMCPVDQTRWVERRAESCDDCQPCLDAARQKLRDRTKAQKAALEGGLTLAEALPGTQFQIENVKGTSKLKKLLSQEGLGAGSIIQVEKIDDSGSLHINIKGYHVSLSKQDASKICVKPI